MEYLPVEMKVWGNLACFTRPEMKVERVSYPVMTPSAARGMLEAIFWKPEFQWEVREIRVLRPIHYYSILRNEVKSRASYRTAQQRIRQGEGFFADEDRTQRHTLALRDVAYIITADIAVRPGVEEDPTKFRAQFRRRLEQGRCYIMPYLGCREFTACFEEPIGDERPLNLSDDLGLMLFDLDYLSDGSGRGQPRFFNARLERGILHVPPELYRKEG